MTRKRKAVVILVGLTTGVVLILMLAGPAAALVTIEDRRCRGRDLEH
jgi:hypothetical protein